MIFLLSTRRMMHRVSIIVLCISSVISGNSSFLVHDKVPLRTDPLLRPAHLLIDDSFQRQVINYCYHTVTTVEHTVATEEVLLQRLLDRLGSMQVILTGKSDELLHQIALTTELVAVIPAETDQKITERIRSALLLQLMVPLDTLVRKMLFTLLDHIDVQLKYWEDQQQRPFYYFFHKSPLKWYSPQSQSAELSENITFLRKQQQVLFQALGAWATHINQFNVEGNIEGQYRWIGDTLGSIYKLLRGEQLELERICEFDKLLSIVRECVARLGRFYGHTMSVLATVDVPPYVVRNWLPCTITGICSLAVVTSLIKHWNAIPAFVQQTKNTLYRTFIQTPRDAIFDAFPFLHGPGHDIMQKKRDSIPPKSTVPTFNELTKEFNDACTHVIDAFGQRAEIMRDEDLIQSYKRTIAGYASLIQSYKMPEVKDGEHRLTEERLNDLAQHLNSRFVVQCINRCFSEDIPQVKSGFLNPSGYTLKADLTFNGVSLVHLFVQLITHFFAGAGTGIQQELMPAIQKIFEAGAVTSDELKQQVQDIFNEVQKGLKQNQVNFALAACIPTAVIIGAGVVGINSLYRKIFYEVDYAPIRRTIISIAHLLNYYDDVQAGPMRSEHYGKLLYLGHKLRKQKLKVPQTQRLEFAQDIKRLEDLPTVQQKLRVIKFMLNYDFLKL